MPPFSRQALPGAPEVDNRTAPAAAAKADIELRPLSDHWRRSGRLHGFVVGFAAVDPRSIGDWAPGGGYS
jgi:hypothetical protein